MFSRISIPYLIVILATLLLWNGQDGRSDLGKRQHWHHRKIGCEELQLTAAILK